MGWQTARRAAALTIDTASKSVSAGPFHQHGPLPVCGVAVLPRASTYLPSSHRIAGCSVASPGGQTSYHARKWCAQREPQQGPRTRVWTSRRPCCQRPASRCGFMAGGKLCMQQVWHNVVLIDRLGRDRVADLVGCAGA